MKLLAVFFLVFSEIAQIRGGPVPDDGYADVAVPDDGFADEDKVDLLQRSDSCTSGWTQINSRCFRYVPKPMTWARAEKHCLSMGGNLASVQDMNEYHQIQMLTSTSSYGTQTQWIGGTNAQELSIWLWSDGSPFSFTGWCSGEPDNYEGTQRCLHINYSGDKCWDDLQCYTLLPSVCAKKV